MTLPILLAEIPDAATLRDAFGHLLGFVLVLFTLAFLWLATALVGKIMVRLEAATSPVDGAAADPPAEAEALDPGVVAAISAAVYHVAGPRARVTHIEREGSAPSPPTPSSS